MSFTDEVSKYHNALRMAMVPHQGCRLVNREIASILLQSNPDLSNKIDWIMASDHCADHTNQGACTCSMTKNAIFNRIGRGKYLVR